jgi:hypothetical protein
LILFFCNSSC